ncbi:hypothetical protein HUJ05_000338 [Dendroctonus ponderosae]|nr:hypothetical protein HUJ05_000338 [Dendroctonus ponderosae]
MALRINFLKICGATRAFATQASRDKVRQNLEAKKKLFQADNDIPVHIKGGFNDQILYQATRIAIFAGVVYSLYTAATMILKSVK